MTIDAKRQSLYAALLRFAPEAGSLRDRVLDRLVLAALIGSSEEQPQRVGAIRDNIRFGSDSPGLRTDLIQDALTRLISIGQVAETELRTRHAYYLTRNGNSGIEKAVDSSASLFEPVLINMLADTSSICTEEIGRSICRRFISECFARFGQQIARVTTGDLRGDELLGAIDAKDAFQSSIEDFALSAAASTSLEARCMRFLQSSTPEDEALKFRLTQGYYIAHLLGLSFGKFNPLADDAFGGAIVYLDSNILIRRLCSDKGIDSFDEIVASAKRLGIELRVSQSTLDEIDTVCQQKMEMLGSIVQAIPDQLARKTNDVFLLSFLEARHANPDLTVDQFMVPFQDIPAILNKIGISLYPETIESVTATVEIAHECSVISKAAEETRGGGKSIRVQQHDACHFVTVGRLRRQGHKAWFLTHDRSLCRAGLALSNGSLSFVLPIAAFLQAISPFLEGTAEEHSLSDLFNDTLGREHAMHGLPSETVFDIQELKLIAEFHSDVLGTSPEQLVLAFDYVKSNILNGRQYQESDYARVALELKKFLSSSSDERQRALQAEIARQESIASHEREKRKTAEREISLEQEKLMVVQSDLRSSESRETVALKQRSQSNRRENLWKYLIMLMGVTLGFFAWTFDTEISRVIVLTGNSTDSPLLAIELYIRIAGSVLMFVVSLPALVSLKKPIRVTSLTCIGALALFGANIMGPELLSTVSGYLALAAPVALIIMLLIKED